MGVAATATAATKPSATPKKAPSTPSAPAKKEPKRYGPLSVGQWIGAVVTLAVVAMVLVWASRAYLSSAGGEEFLAKYPGHAPMPDSAPIGTPVWLTWSHFFNVFLMALIVRTGWAVRTERRPAAYWSPKWNPKRKISLTLWLHQALDLLWVINGLIFFILLFTTGQWMKIVPTSWEVFPNALSSGLQYLSLDWPTENGWVHYNALQQIAYFLTVFVAAPLAIISGVRMSGMWPAKNTTLNKIYPAPLARKIHFPTMIYFIVFLCIHVFLVVATGLLRNLNNMFAARGDVDPEVWAHNWLGFILFVIAMLVTAAGWYFARAIFVAPIARGFGAVTNR